MNKVLKDMVKSKILKKIRGYLKFIFQIEYINYLNKKLHLSFFSNLKLYLNYIKDSFQAFVNRERNIASEILYYKRSFQIEKDPKRYLDLIRKNRGIPEELSFLIEDLKKQFNTNILQVLEIGSGPNSNLAYYVDRNIFNVIAIDPVADVYRDIMKTLNYNYPIMPLKIKGEDLLKYYKKETFQIVYSHNSLDHTEDPIRCIINAFKLLKKNGILYITNNVKEGSRKNWLGLHKYDLYFHNNELILSGKECRPIEILKKYKLNLKLIWFKEYTLFHDLKRFTAVYKKI